MHSAQCFEYRFAFNGKEQDPEVSGQGNSYDYGFRIYNPRLGKFLSVDPLAGSYPWYTPYQFAGNMPIAAIDLDGLEEWVVIRWTKNNKLVGITILHQEKDNFVAARVNQELPGLITFYKNNVKKFNNILQNSIDSEPQSRKAIKERAETIEKYKGKVRRAKKGVADNKAKLDEQTNAALAQYGKFGQVTYEVTDDFNPNDPSSVSKQYFKVAGADALAYVSTLPLVDEPSASNALLVNTGVLAADAITGQWSVSQNHPQAIEDKISIYSAIVPQTVKTNFASNNAVLSDGDKEQLNDVFFTMSLIQDLNITITGHTDNVGSAGVNLALSLNRASAASDYLISKGISADRFKIDGKGVTRPISDNSTAEGRADNRRLELTVNPSN